MSKVCLLVDFDDSFFFNIKELVQIDLGYRVICLQGSDLSQCEKIYNMNDCDFLVLGPGPGHIDDYQLTDQLWRFFETIPVIGICLGHQLLLEKLGGELVNLERPMHGRACEMLEFGELFNIPQFKGQFYNSWAHISSSAPLEEWVEYQNMIIYFKLKKWIGVQFHPESVGTTFPKDVFNGLIQKIV